jgi:hypothetical protein
VNGDPSKHIIIVVDPNDEFGVHLVKASYCAALREEDAAPKPNADLELMALIGAPYIMVLPLAATKAAIERTMVKATEALTTPPQLNHVRVLVIQDTENGEPGATVLTCKAPPSKRPN